MSNITQFKQAALGIVGGSTDIGALTGTITPSLANGAKQYGYMTGNVVFEVPTGSPVECGSEIEFVIQWSAGQTLDFAEGIMRASDSAATFPKTLTAYRSYIFKIKFQGGRWCLVSLVGGFEEIVD